MILDLEQVSALDRLLPSDFRFIDGFWLSEGSCHLNLDLDQVYGLETVIAI